MNLNFVQHDIIDQQQQGIVAGHFEYPATWDAESNIFWNYQNTTLPVVSYIRIANPEGFETFEFLPMEGFSWTANLPLMSGVDALVHLIIPKYRSNRQNLRVIKTDSRAVSAQKISQAHRVSVKIEYLENGRMIEEEFQALHAICGLPVNNGWETTYFTGWNLTELCCFRAESGQFENVRKTFLKIRASLKPNPQWIKLSSQISQTLLQNSQYTANASIGFGREKIQVNSHPQLAVKNKAPIKQSQIMVDSIHNTRLFDQFESTRLISTKFEKIPEKSPAGELLERKTIYKIDSAINESIKFGETNIQNDDFESTRIWKKEAEHELTLVSSGGEK